MIQNVQGIQSEHHGPSTSQHVPHPQRTKLSKRQPVVLRDWLPPLHRAGEHGGLLPTTLPGDEDALCVEASNSHSILKTFQGFLVDVRVSAYRRSQVGQGVKDRVGGADRASLPAQETKQLQAKCESWPTQVGM